MQILRACAFVLLSFSVLTVSISAKTDEKTNSNLHNEIMSENKPAVNEKESAEKKIRLQQLVEEVDIQGNRRLRDDDLLYYIKTRAGDVYNQAQVESDLQQLLSLNFFDKTATRVLTEPGVRGGVRVIFEVAELPVIRDLQFKGANAISEADILKAFREQRVRISKEERFDPVAAQKGTRVIRELLASRGYPNATVKVEDEEVSATSTAVTFDIDQGNRSRIVDIEFEGNEHFSDGELRNQLQYVQETGIIARYQGADILDLRKLEADLQRNVKSYMFSKGYFQARIGEPEVVGLGYKRTGPPILKELPLPIITSKDDTLKVIVPVTEGKVFRVGELKVEGNSIFSEQQVLGYVGLKKGEIADGKRLQKAVFEDLKTLYGSQGFVLYDAGFDPDFKENPGNPNEGIVDITINIDEGRQFRLRRLEFVGNTFTRDRVIRREFFINEGDIYNQIALERSVVRINQTQYFDPVDKDQDVEIRTNEDQGDVDLIVKVRERGRQQISFNGGVAGIGGSFFGLEYSTNNLLGRGEVLSFQFAFGNRQRNFTFSFQEPYLFDRPISAGFSLFTSSYKFFGEGTQFSQNQDLLFDAFNPQGILTTDERNLFTQNTYGANVFVTSPLSEFFFKKRAFTQFSRIGLSYQFSATTIKDPEANSLGDPNAVIPVIFAQPNILTSRITPTFAYDTRRPTPDGIDTLSGTQISASFALSGLGGDVRTYQPEITYTQFIPVRRKRSGNPEVFGFRIQAGTIGSFSINDTIRNANSLSFIGGVPIYERYFLGSEYDIRGYANRTLSPFAPYNTYITSQNVVVASNIDGTPQLAGIDNTTAQQIAQLGLFTGASGTNPALLQNFFQRIGGDTRLLGNFEYRIPVFGPVSLAAFADIGTVFNLRDTGIQTVNSNFLSDSIFGSSTLTTQALVNNPNLANSIDQFGRPSLIFFRNRLLDRNGLLDLCGLNIGCPQSLPAGVDQLFLRGDVQTNALLDVDNSAFDDFKNFSSSIGLELRVQVPVVNVPFRLIYYYNPNARVGSNDELPFSLPGKRSGLRFTIGRTF